MKTEILPLHSQDALALALRILREGGVVAFPTDTVYGLGALAAHAEGIERLFLVKERPREKAIPVLLDSADSMSLVSDSIPRIARRLAARFFPGALTLVIPRRGALPEILSPLPTVGVRVPNHVIASRLLRPAGAMAVTSANRSGQPAPRTAEGVYAQLRGRIPLILDGGETPGGIPSTVVDCTVNPPRILREGPISTEEIFAALEDGDF